NECKFESDLFGEYQACSEVAGSTGDEKLCGTFKRIVQTQVGRSYANGRRHRQSESRLQRIPHSLEGRQPRHPVLRKPKRSMRSCNSSSRRTCGSFVVVILSRFMS